MADYMFYKYLNVFLPWLLGAEGFMFDVVNVLPEGNFQHCLRVDFLRDEEIRVDASFILRTSTCVSLGGSPRLGNGVKEDEQPLREHPYVTNLVGVNREEGKHMQQIQRKGGRADSTGKPEVLEDEVVLMQRKRGRSPTPRRRRRARAERQADRQRQENRHSWQIGAARSRARTETCSKRPLVAPWSRGKGSRHGASRPSAAPASGACGTSAAPPTSSGVPDIPPLGEGSGNIMWWSEMLGLQDPMLENDRVLENQTVDCLVENLRAMSPNQRTAMVAQIVPFLGALLAEVLRAINLAQLPAPEATEIVDDEEAEEDENALFQLGAVFGDNADNIQAEEGDLLEDGVSMMQQYDATIPFGSKLSQLQGHLEGFDSIQSNQVACHLRIMVQRLRQLAGTTSPQVTDRFQRLEALIASYFTEEVEVPLSLQSGAKDS